MKEQWRYISGYKGYYQVSNLGRVRSVNRLIKSKGDGVCKARGQVLRTNTCNNYGYHQITLRKERTRKTFLIHQLVALTWIGPRPPGMWVRHGPNGRLDNSVRNLSYGTPSENARDRFRDGTMYDERTRGVMRGDGVEFPCIAEAARESKCDASNIAAACRGDRYKTVGGYSWEFIEDSI